MIDNPANPYLDSTRLTQKVDIDDMDNGFRFVWTSEGGFFAICTGEGDDVGEGGFKSTSISGDGRGSNACISTIISSPFSWLYIRLSFVTKEKLGGDSGSPAKGKYDGGDRGNRMVVTGGIGAAEFIDCGM